ncbi:uncharacterized protein METZ01_LOCUS213423, partial [marine metagenome]
RNQFVTSTAPSSLSAQTLQNNILVCQQGLQIWLI